MGEHVIYAHKVESGIKIGYSSNYKSRLSQYKSHGDIIKEIKVVNIISKDIDDILKKYLYQLGLNIQIPNQTTSTEVYNLDETKVLLLLNYIENNDNILYENVETICMNNVWTQKIITLSEFRNLYAIFYVDFPYQRPVDEKHASTISNYIMDNYSNVCYNLQSITVLKIKNNKYEIVDGAHRTKAILDIPEGHPSLKSNILLTICNLILDENRRINIFRNINNCKPMADIFVKENYLKTLSDYLKTELKKNYNFDCVLDKKRNNATEYITYNEIDEFTTSKNITDLLKLNMVKGLDHKEFLYLLIDINNGLYQAYVELLGYDVFTGKPIDNILDNNVVDDDELNDDTNNVVNDEINWNDTVKFYNIHNKNNRLTVTPFKKVCNKIKNNYYKSNTIVKKRGQVRKKITKVPFLLGLNIKTTIYELCVNLDTYLSKVGLALE